MRSPEQLRKRRWREENADKVRAQRAAWKKANAEKHRKSSRDWYAKNKERHAAVQKQRESANPEKVRLARRVREARRRARKLNSGETYSLADVREKLELQQGKCFYCSDILTDYHIDHFVPLSRGGTNGANNIVISCPPCNLIKGARMPDDPTVWRDIDARKQPA